MYSPVLYVLSTEVLLAVGETRPGPSARRPQSRRGSAQHPPLAHRRRHPASLSTQRTHPVSPPGQEGGVEAPEDAEESDGQVQGVAAARVIHVDLPRATGGYSEAREALS